MTGCSKSAYESHKFAKKTAKSLGKNLRSYRCPECGMIHLTSDRGKKKRERRKRTRLHDKTKREKLEREQKKIPEHRT